MAFAIPAKQAHNGRRLVSRTSALRDDVGHLVHLSLAALEGAESLLGELARALVLAVAQQFDDAAFVGRETMGCQRVSFYNLLFGYSGVF